MDADATQGALPQQPARLPQGQPRQPRPEPGMYQVPMPNDTAGMKG